MPIDRVPRGVKWLSLPPYKQVVMLITNDAAERAFIRMFGDPLKGEGRTKGYAGKYENDATGEVFFFVAVFGGKLSTLAHECSHAAMAICKHVGIHITPDNDEAHAYIVGWLFEQFEPYVVRSRKKK